MRWLEIEQDVHYATRTLRRSPGFATVAVLTLALGIGATTAIYSVVDTILLQPLPFAGADDLVQIAENVPSSVPGRPPFQRAVTYQEFLEWRSRSTTLADAFAVSTGENVVRTREGTARLWGATISANTFTVLGAVAMLGRTLLAGDAANPNVVVLGFDTWRRLLNASFRRGESAAKPEDFLGSSQEARRIAQGLLDGSVDWTRFAAELDRLGVKLRLSQDGPEPAVTVLSLDHFDDSR